MEDRKHYTIQNPKDIETYLRSFAEGDSALCDQLIENMRDVLAQRPANIRTPNEEELGENDILSDEGLLNSIRRDVLNSAIYVFDPSIDPTLEQKVRNVADLLKAKKTVMNDFWGNDIDINNSPGILRPEFMRAAETVIEMPAQENKQEVATLSVASEPIKTIIEFEDDWKIIRYHGFDHLKK